MQEIIKDYSVIELPNGIRVVYKHIAHTHIVHCGYVFDIGSRDEDPGNEGLAHFWEHMAFKGTEHRKTFHIVNAIESEGGELNAYTTKEKICFYVSILDRHLLKAAEILTDIAFHSVFPDKEIEKEKSVISEEMMMYRDSPDDAIQDEFDSLVFNNHPLGNNILGTEESLKLFTKDHFIKFINDKVSTSKVVFSIVGNFSKADLNKVIDRILKNVPAKDSAYMRKSFSGYTPIKQEIKKDNGQCHYMLGADSLPFNHKDRLAFFLMMNVLGGSGMNSRLNLILREKYAYVYAIEAQYQPYTDTGLAYVYFATDPSHLKRCIDLAQREIHKIATQPLGSLQLHRAKQQLCGQLAMGEESNMNLMLIFGKSLLDNGRIESLQEIFKQINEVNANKITEVASNYFNLDRLSSLTYTT